MKLTKNVGNLSQQTNIPTCQRSHLLVTYQTLAYLCIVSCSDGLQFQKWTSCHDISSYHDMKLHDIRYKILSGVVAVLIREYTEMHKSVREYARIYQPLPVFVSAPAHQDTVSGMVGCTRREHGCTPAEKDDFYVTSNGPPFCTTSNR